MKSNRIQNYRQIYNRENFFLDSAIYSVGQAVGVTYENGFQPVSAITGDLFTYLYSDEKPCDSGLTNYFFIPEAVERAYWAFGYACESLSQAEINADLDAALAKIRLSIDRGIPVLAWGCGGVEMITGERYDPLPEGCLIGGYDEHNLLYINLYPGKERLAERSACGKPGVDEDGYTAIFADTALATTNGIFLLSDPLPKPDAAEVYRLVLTSIPHFLSRQPENGYTFGKQAFEKWASVLLTDAYWKDPQTAEANSWDKHCSAFCALCTSIGVGGGDGIVGYVRKLAGALPDSPEANAVLPLFQRLRQLNQAIWDYQGGFFPPSDKLTNHEYREGLAQILRQMGAVCDEILAIFA